MHISVMDLGKVYDYKNLSVHNFSLQLITETYKNIQEGKEIYFLDGNNKPIKVKSITKEDYTGRIYDVDVENDIVLVRRKNSSAIWSGNSNSQDVFDLKIIGDNGIGVEFDYIVDPQANDSSNQVYQCGTLDSPGTYTLNQSITNNTEGIGSCINITVPDVILDCGSYANYISAEHVPGIYSNSTNTTISGCNISLGVISIPGIQLSGANDSYIYDNTLGEVSLSTSYGIYLLGVYNTTIENNTAISSMRGVSLDASSDYNKIINNTVNSNINGIYIGGSSDYNTIKDNTANSNTQNGIYLGGSNNTLINNTANSNSVGIVILGNYNNLTNNDIWNCTTTLSGCLFFEQGDDNAVSGGVINLSASNLIYLDGVGGPANNNVFRDMQLIGATTNDTYLIDDSINNTFINVTYNSSKEYIEAGSELIRKWYYRAYVNDTLGNDVSGANVLAYNGTNRLILNATTNSSGWTNITEIIEYVNSGGTKSYYSLYSINARNSSYGDGIISTNISGNLLNDTITMGQVKGCGWLTTPGNSNLSANIINNALTGACINITAQNVSLDCNGYTLGGNLNSFGIYAKNLLNITVKNCLITNFSRAVSLDSVNKSWFDNLTIFNNNGTYSAIYMYLSYNNSFTNNNISFNNATDNSGIYIYSSNNNIIENNTFENNSVAHSIDDFLGGGIISLYINSRGNVFRSNEFIGNKMNIVTSSKSIYGGGIIGIYDGSNGNNFNNTQMINNEVKSRYWIYGGGVLGLRKSDNNTFLNISFIGNNVTSSFDFRGGGIMGLDNSSNNTFTTITLTNNTAHTLDDIEGGGILGLYPSSNNNTFIDVNLTGNKVTSDSRLRGGGIIGMGYNGEISIMNSFSNINIADNEIDNQYGGIDAGGVIGLYYTHNNTFTNIILQDNNISSPNNFGTFGLKNADNNIFSGGIINLSASNLIYLDTNSDNNVFRDIQLIGAATNDTYLIDSSINNTFINVTYNSSKEYVELGSELIRKWYYQAYVNDTNRGDVPNANITGFNVSGAYDFNLTSNASGWTSIGEITDYVNYGGNRSYYSNYTIFATNGSGIMNLPYNSTLNENKLDNVFTLDNIPPVVTLIGIPGTASSNIIDYLYNATDNSSITYCSLIIDGVGVANDTDVNNTGTNETITYTTPVGTHAYYINCTDSFLNTGSSGSGTIVVISTTTTVTEGGGGGGGTRSISLKIEVPSSINLEEKGRVEIPITLNNDGQTDLNKINLVGYVLKNSVLSNIKVEFDKDYFESLKKNTKEGAVLTTEISADEVAVYEIVINASSASPVYNAKAVVYLNFVGKEASGVKKMIVFADNMVVENPECLELKEMVDDAKKAFEEGRFQEAIMKSNKAIEACRESISGPKQSVFSTLRGQENILIYLGVGIVLAIILGVIVNIYKRIWFRKK